MDGLINLMEETVVNKIDKLWPTSQYCKCDICKKNVAIMSLNRLPARYVSSLEGAMLHKFDSSSVQMDVEITAAVCKAMQEVGEAPEHD